MLLVLLVLARQNCVRAFYCRLFFFFQAEDGIRDLVRSRGLGDVYKRQGKSYSVLESAIIIPDII